MNHSLLKEIMYIQNLDLLQRIANDMFEGNTELRDNFISKYHKKNFNGTLVTKNKIDRYSKTINRIARKK